MKLRPGKATRGKWRILDGKGGEWCVFMFRDLKLVGPCLSLLRTTSLDPGEQV
jgi:hypothetical protein